VAPLRVKFDEECSAVELNGGWQAILPRGARGAGVIVSSKPQRRICSLGLCLAGERTQAPDCARAGPAAEAHNESTTSAPYRRFRGDAMTKLRAHREARQLQLTPELHCHDTQFWLGGVSAGDGLVRRFVAAPFDQGLVTLPRSLLL
jgi:hypothetical protein